MKKSLPYILFEKYISILALETASPGNQHCANCTGSAPFRALHTWLMTRVALTTTSTRLPAAVVSSQPASTTDFIDAGACTTTQWPPGISDAALILTTSTRGSIHGRFAFSQQPRASCARNLSPSSKILYRSRGGDALRLGR